MNINFNDGESLKREFKKKIYWFEEEFDLIFKNKTHSYSLEDIKLANQILDKLSETLNEYRNEKLLYPLVKALNNIENKHPEFFLK